MRLTPKEIDRLTIFTAAELAASAAVGASNSTTPKL